MAVYFFTPLPAHPQKSRQTSEQHVKSRGIQEYEVMDSTLDGKVVLVKGRHRYEFRYQQGSELAALDAFVALAGNNQSDFDWFDAAVLSYQISKNFSQSDELAGQDDDYPQSQEDVWP